MSTVDGEITNAYRTWNHMVNRCYSPNSKDYKNYGGKGVFVCDEWHNFQTFAMWYLTNYPDDGQRYDLDKDGKHSGNEPKSYSPSTCQFITRSENLRLINR